MDDEFNSENHIYVIGGISYEKHTSHFDKDGRSKFTTPEFVKKLDLRNLDELVRRFDELFLTNVIIHFVDPQLKIRYYYTPEGRAYFNMLHDIREDESRNNIIFHDCQWYELQLDFRNNPENNYYFVTDDGDFECSYDFLNFLEMRISGNIYLKYGITSLLDVLDAKCPYNVFLVPDEALTSRMEIIEENMEEINWIIGVRTVQAFIRAGFLNKERYVQNSIPCWVLNTESHFTKGIIMEYEIYPPIKVMHSKRVCVGKTVQEKFTESAEYRYLITDTICRVLCKLGIRYGKFSEVKLHHKVNFERLLE
jgi:hypothetical protein